MQIPFYIEFGLIIMLLGAGASAWFLALFIVMDLKRWVDDKKKEWFLNG